MEKVESKEEKRFKKTIEAIRAILHTDNIALPKKAEASELGNLVSELFEEEKARINEEVKEGLKSLIIGKANLDKAINDKIKELEKLKTEKYTEFCKQADNLFAKIDNISSILGDYERSLEETISVVTRS